MLRYDPAYEVQPIYLWMGRMLVHTSDHIYHIRLHHIANCVALVVVALCAIFQQPTCIAQQDDQVVKIEIEQFGVGNIARAGEWVGMQLSLTSYQSEPQSALAVWELIDIDGDIVEQASPIVLNPGARDRVWLYGLLSPNASAGTKWRIAVYELNDKRRRGALLGSRQYSASSVLEPTQGMVGIIGSRAEGVAAFNNRAPGKGLGLGASGGAIAGHETFQLVGNLQVANLPSAWMGLSCFDVLIWTEGDPLTLSADQAGAIEEWVYRGGHLVIVLPRVIQGWRNTRLQPILPEVSLVTLEDQELRDINSCGGILQHLMREPESSRTYQLTKQQRPPAFPVIDVHVMLPQAAATWGETNTYPILNFDPTKVDAAAMPSDFAQLQVQPAIATQRHVGFGQVSMVGVPINHPHLNRRGVELPEAEVFWSAVLGWRQDTPSAAELDRISRTVKNADGLNEIRRKLHLWKHIGNKIKLSSYGGKGVVIALFLFIAYWLISGPGLFAFFKAKGLQQYNWMGFVIAIIVFAFIGFGTTKLLRSNEIRPRHFTVLDHIANEDWERSFTYVTIPLEGYGSRNIEARSTVDQTDDVANLGRWRNTVTAFHAPGSQVAGFPDPRRYEVVTTRQAAIDAPARNTAKQVAIESLHPPIEGWGMPNYENIDDRPRLVQRSGISGEGLQTHPVGKLVHHLPQELEKLAIIVVVPEQWNRFGRRRDGKLSGASRFEAYSLSLPGGTWKPGEELDLAQLDLSAEGVSMWVGKGKQPGYLGRIQNVITKSDSFDEGNSDVRFNFSQEIASIEALGWFKQLDPPQWVGKSEEMAEPMLLRSTGRRMDISPWLNRPCLIITGHMIGMGQPLEIPTLIRIDGKPLEPASTDSHVFVRWIYPFGPEVETN